jgi:signal peptidase I
VEPRSGASGLQAGPAGGETPEPGKTHEHGRLFEWLWLTSIQSLATTIVIAVFVITFIVQAFQIPSESMENTLLIGDYLLVDKVHYANGGFWGHILPYSDIQRGEIVVFRYPVHPAQHFVKRVIGVPGDHIRLVNRQVYVNGTPVREPYVVYHSPMPDAYRDDFPAPNYVSANVEARWWLEMHKLIKRGELVVPDDAYFVLGDNRDESLDSRYWGFVPRENVIGRPLVIYWSLQRDDGADDASPPDGKLSRLAGVFVRFYHDTRWNRTLRLVR